MKRYLSVFVAACCAVTLAQYDELWVSDEVGLPQSINVLGIQNTDTDPQDEMIYTGEEVGRYGTIYIWALDLLYGDVERITDDFYYIFTEQGKEPRLIDINANGRYEVLFLGQEHPGDYAAWFLYGNTAAGAGGPKYTRLRGQRLGQNVPNPVSRQTRIDFEVEKQGQALVRVYDQSGRLVKDISAGALDPGRHSVTWQRDDQDGRPVAPGAYFYVLEADGRKTAKKALVAE